MASPAGGYRHIAEDGTEYRDCFVDSDRVVRLPYGRPGAESVTHWAALPALPGLTVHRVVGGEARTVLRDLSGRGIIVFAACAQGPVGAARVRKPR